MSPNFKNIEAVYFVGIGGIGMSALARYFNAIGKYTAGYDKTASAITLALKKERIDLHYDNELGEIPTRLLKFDKNSVLVVYTPAIPDDNSELRFFIDNGYTLKKRSEILGIISENQNSIAVAGTHGKTSVSTLLAHIFKFAGLNFNAILGGVSKNYNSNILLADEPENVEFLVTEADEFDRSFLELKLQTAVITAIDEDHLDIYAGINDLTQTFEKFINQIDKDGTVIIKKGLDIDKEYLPKNSYTYSLSSNADFYAQNITNKKSKITFDIKTPNFVIDNLELKVSGKVNIENAVAAVAVASLNGVDENVIRQAVASWEGVKRRFDYIIDTPKLTFIDDYAHHPEELKALISSVRELYPDKKISGIFQPHLYTRTRDFADEFAESLSLLDELILLDIYPAREQPIEGVSSELIFNKVTIDDKMLCRINELMTLVISPSYEVLLTIGAGNIDRFVEPIKESLSEVYDL